MHRRAVEVFALGVIAGARVVATNDEVGAAVVFTDQTVPNRLAWASHTHGKVQQGHRCCGGWILVKHRFVAAHAGKVINVAWLGQAHNWVDQQVGLGFFGGAERQFLMGAVQWVACLERNNFAPAHFAEIGAQLIWCVAASAEIIVYWLLDACDRTTKVDVACCVVQVVHGRVRAIVSTENHFGFTGFVWHPLVGDRHGRQNHAFLVAQGDVLADFKVAAKSSETSSVIGIGHSAPLQAHVVDDTVIISFGQEPLERVKPPFISSSRSQI